jgi:hypothetical protein
MSKVDCKVWSEYVPNLAQEQIDYIRNKYKGIYIDHEFEYSTDLPLSKNSGFNIKTDSYRKMSAAKEYGSNYSFEYWEVDLDIVLDLCKTYPSVDRFISILNSICWYYQRNNDFAFSQLKTVVGYHHPWFDCIFPQDNSNFGIVNFKGFYLANIPSLPKQTVITLSAAKRLGMCYNAPSDS